MHDAWNVYDIRYLIVQHLGRQDLARLARTRGIFFDVATDKLWKTVYGFTPFICCLSPAPGTRKLSAEDVRRLDIYGCKVRTLEIRSSGGIGKVPKLIGFENRGKCVNVARLWKQLWEEVHAVRPVSEFLPNLRRLRLDYVNKQQLTPILGITGSNLTSIHLERIHTHLKKVLSNFMNRFRKTSCLKRLYSSHVDPDVIPLRIIQDSPLYYLDIDREAYWDDRQRRMGYEYPLLVGVLQKSTLRHLALHLGRDWLSDSFESLHGKYLPKLKNLCLKFGYSTDGDYGKLRNIEAAGTGLRQVTRLFVWFLERLENPELEGLEIMFPAETTGSSLLEVMKAVKNNCRLQNLAELALSGHSLRHLCAGSLISPQENRAALDLLLPLPSLKVLRLSVAPDFLDILDLDLYRDFTTQFPLLQSLQLGLDECVECCEDCRGEWSDLNYYERFKLRNLAAFCSLLPKLTKVIVQSIEWTTLEEIPNSEWASQSVSSLHIQHWSPRTPREADLLDRLYLNLETYFPKSENTINWR